MALDNLTPVDEVDFIVVGAGSAGCVLASRLADDLGATVVILEAGKQRWPKVSAIPAAVLHTVGHPKYDWQYQTEPDASRANRVEPWPRGKGPGGSSLINGMIFVRGCPNDFDDWERAGATGWSYRDVLPSFMRLETAPHAESQTRGSLGPQTVSNPRYHSPVTKMFIDASVEAGLPFNSDYNDGEQEGISYVQGIQKNGRRESAFDAFLKPKLSQPNLTLLEETTVRRVIFENRKAVGVEMERGGQTSVLRARRLVVLAAGVFNTPQILMLSGIGPASRLKALGLEVLCDAPEVGENLMEHVGIGIQAELSLPTLNQEATPLRMAINMLKWFTGTGPATATIAHAIGFVRTLPGLGSPDVQLQFTPIGFAVGPKGIYISGKPLVTVMPSINFPKSKGSVKLRDTDPRSKVLIYPNLLGHRDDYDTLSRGIDLSLRILSAPTLAKFMVGLVDPIPENSEERETYIRSRAAPIYHPVGTCRMGNDPASVVDPLLRVRGVRGLVVADASIMPRHLSGNTHASSMMIGERAAELIKSPPPQMAA